MVTNSLKYAFNNADTGEISIEIVQKTNHFELVYTDNGSGYSTDINFENTSTLGFQLITSLTEQLNGKIQRELIKQGTCYRLFFESI
jgi:two-component sensor histidine kinase